MGAIPAYKNRLDKLPGPYKLYKGLVNSKDFANYLKKCFEKKREIIL
jgi:hypothetical protein